jgi:nucleoside-diphosphate-sugar epimerase
MAIDPTPTKVLVTGANGFIGLHTVLHFLKAGYNLCATVRTKDQGESVRQTIAKHTDTHKLEFIHADLMRDEGWDYSMSTEQARSILGWQPRLYEETILSMAESLIEQGMV